jgi:hypothetical protein
MNYSSDRHRRLLGDLITLSASSADRDELNAFFDWDGEPVMEMTVANMVSVLDRYLSREVTSQQLEDWAESLVGRSDVALQSDAEELIKQVLFEISTPEINFKISPSQVSVWRRRLTAEA